MDSERKKNKRKKDKDNISKITLFKKVLETRIKHYF